MTLKTAASYLSIIPAIFLQAGVAQAQTAAAGHAGHSTHADESDANDPHAAHRAQMTHRGVGESAAASVKLTDAVLTDQNGNDGRLTTDFLGGRVAVFDFIFTTCTTICPVTTTMLAAAKMQLDDVDPDEYVFVSISIDPNVDTPERMAAFAESRGADWTFLTGDKLVIDKVLRDLDSYSTNPEDHAAMSLIGDASTGEFTRTFGIPSPDMVAAEVRRRVAARHSSHQHHGT